MKVLQEELERCESFGCQCQSKYCYTVLWALQSIWYGWDLPSDAEASDFRDIFSQYALFWTPCASLGRRLPKFSYRSLRKITIQTERVSDLRSFPLKYLERPVKHSARKRAFRAYSLSENSMVLLNDDGTLRGKYRMRVLLNVERTFGCPPFIKLCDVTREHSIDDNFVKWIYVMLLQRLLCAEFRVTTWR